MVKIITLFLIAVLVLGMFGKLRVPGLTRSKNCPSCGRPRIGRGPCQCGAKG